LNNRERPRWIGWVFVAALVGGWLVGLADGASGYAVLMTGLLTMGAAIFATSIFFWVQDRRRR
jgi:hypothetical protein